MGCASLSYALKLSAFQGAFFSAIAMTMLDFLIEPIAIDLDFWSWEATAIPLTNYLAWFAASFVFALFTRPILNGSRSKRAEIFIFIQITFFGCLNLFL
jgi:putative membrane protein